MAYTVVKLLSAEWDEIGRLHYVTRLFPLENGQAIAGSGLRNMVRRIKLRFDSFIEINNELIIIAG